MKECVKRVGNPDDIVFEGSTAYRTRELGVGVGSDARESQQAEFAEVSATNASVSKWGLDSKLPCAHCFPRVRSSPSKGPSSKRPTPLNRLGYPLSIGFVILNCLLSRSGQSSLNFRIHIKSLFRTSFWKENRSASASLNISTTAIGTNAA